VFLVDDGIAVTSSSSNINAKAHDASLPTTSGGLVASSGVITVLSQFLRAVRGSSARPPFWIVNISVCVCFCLPAAGRHLCFFFDGVWRSYAGDGQPEAD